MTQQIVVMDKTTRAITAATSALQKAMAEASAGVDNLVQTEVELGHAIADKNLELQAVEEQVEHASRKAAADLKLRIYEDENTVLAQLLEARGLVTTTAEALQAQAQELRAAQQLAQRTEIEAVGVAVKAAKAEADMELQRVQSQHAVEIAQLTANAASSQETISLLKGQITSLQESINATREADVKKAEAAANAKGDTFNIGK